MTVKAQRPIVIFRGDNTAAFDLRTITILLTGDLDLSHATAKFTLLDFSKTWTEQEVATGELIMVFTAEQTKAFALGPQTGTLRLYDMSTGTPRQLTVVNKIPFFVTNRVCEMDSQSYEADVCVSGGDVIHVEFNVGAGAVEGKADKVKNATAGDLASLTAEGNLVDSGIPKTDVLRKSQMDSTPTLGSQNPVTSDGIKQALDLATPSDYAQVKAQVEQNTGDIAGIKEVIPNQASAQNQLADKDFVNSSIATNTATFRGSYNLVSDLGLTVSATEQQVAAAIAAKLASLVPPVVPENNDYCFVQVPKTDADPTVIVRVDRYKCTVTESGGVTTRVWEYEWSLNNSSFTAEQWAAINSGITSGLVEKLNGIEAGAQVNAVASVNSKTGAVTLSASDVEAVPTTGGTMTGALTMNKSVIELKDATGYKRVLRCTGTGGDFYIDYYNSQGTLVGSILVPSASGNNQFAFTNSPAFTGTPTASDASGQTPSQVANVKFVQGALPYAIASVPSGDALADRTVNTKTVNVATYAPSFPAETSGKSCDFYLAITSDTAGTVSAPSGKTLNNAKGESANLDYEANKTTVLRFTQIGTNTYVVTGGANGGGSIDPATLNTKANSTALAPDWRAGNVDTAYAVNAYITYNGNAYECMVAYTATSSSPTPDNDIYDDTVTPATGHWKLTDMTTPDATLDITSQGSLRVVSAGGQTLWQQGYKLKTTSSATLDNEAVNRYGFAANATANVSLTLPTPPTDKVGDFVLDVTNPALDTATFTQSAFDSAQTYAVGAEVIYDSKIWRCITAVSTAGAWTGTTNWEEAWPYFSIAGLPTTVEMVVPKGENLSEILTFAPGTRCELYFTLTSFNENSHPTWKVVRQDVEVVA